MYLALTLLIGLLCAACGISYKVSSIGKAEPIQNAVCMALFGIVLFGVLAIPQAATCSWRVIVVGVILGASLYGGISLLRLALQAGPLSPAWCAQALVFIPVILYAWLALGEKISTWQFFSILATVGAILAASGGAGGGAKAVTLRGRLYYGFLLLAILVVISVFNVGLKFSGAYCEPGCTGSMAARSSSLMLFFAYAALAVLGVADLTCRKAWKNNRYAWIGGALLAIPATSVHGLTLAIVDKVPAALLFALSNATSILVASLISTLFFHEKRTAAWYWTVGFSLLAVLLNH